ncbi:MAG: UDP-N-acetylmuramoyl-L-alanyl-D-glutamate--2,6-diaminopimelate ligase [Alicyclobacillus herbarius]|uniref:UDP-N-acetylmuramoyl-L-alanyl-D-glutamate--2, 6-diaminopimelate ligase n=1 Tax=Alicyclobacillus herbarius TaxID=122960 RepID=UPI00235277D3|nr:UDP-N-acetylmuramoyl-L-alanyl-D-glutamate--2,6-diaminopimelate ligase [Alicyclobacillus herbarius]MCL6631694.1 UDP-N-acetylmuramoyl-L-alanyl-D-glutamate--2,6-diaminopimelate ligase [Alicyclobacillus herbarius]
MQLSQLLHVLVKKRLVGSGEVEIHGVSSDSRTVVPGDLFVAQRGYTVDGHQFAADAVLRGAVAVVCERVIEGLRVPQLVVPDSRLAGAILADLVYGHPSHQLQVIGVTGTNGKTTVTHLIERVLQAAGHKTGLIGTLGSRIDGRLKAGVNTTPEAVELQSLFSEMVQSGCRYGIMEVSSHALEERRVAGTRFHIGVFTNLTQDHLDYHGTMENYRAAKGKLFSRLGNTYGNRSEDCAYAVLNADDPASDYMRAQTVAEVVTFGIEQAADVKARDIQLAADGARFWVDSFRGSVLVGLHLMGRFNVYNALAAFAVGLIEGLAPEQIAAALGAVEGIPGRLEAVDVGQPFTVLVDYAHTPDSVQNALETIQEFARRRIICVVGCGGDRDKGKRPIMAETACKYADWTILTSDNPRTEDPEAILDGMEAGVRAAYSGRYERIVDRREAIERAIRLAEPEDVVLIAGKGHETYQIIGHTKHPFDDRAVARAAILARS